MATGETQVVHDILKRLSKFRVFMMKHVRGGFYPIAAVKPLIAAVLNENWAKAAEIAKGMRPLQAGLSMPGSSDIIGILPVVVTQEMVGKTVGLFFACEVKKEDGVKGEDQIRFNDLVKSFGGVAGFAFNTDDAEALIKRPVS